MSEIVGVHPYADKFPMLPDGELAAEIVGVADLPVVRPCGVPDDEFRAGELKIARALSTRRGRPQRRPAEFVYFIQAGTTGPIKIGSATYPDSRLRNLQVGHADELRILATETGGGQRERELHRQFAADHIRGEWFKPSSSLLMHIAQVSR